MNLEEFYARHNSRYGVRLIVAILFLIFSTAYFTWRSTVFNPEAWGFSIIFFAAEIFGLIITVFTLFITWRVKERRPIKPEPNLKVDVFIPTYNESVDIVRLTALAVKNIRYPHGTWILDDGKRSDIKQLAEELGCKYLTREDNSHAKAGNLNNALKYSEADFIALFDADHVPEENFLDRLLGYFNDPDVAYVQSPQDFYNIDSFQFNNNIKKKLLWHDQTFFYQIGQAGRDYWNATSFCGTTSVVRRSALDAVGGFATETVTEDMHTAVKLQKLADEPNRQTAKYQWGQAYQAMGYRACFFYLHRTQNHPLQGQGGRAAQAAGHSALAALPGPHKQQVGPQRLDPGGDGLLDSPSDGHQGNYRRHADYDAQQG